MLLAAALVTPLRLQLLMQKTSLPFTPEPLAKSCAVLPLVTRKDKSAVEEGEVDEAKRVPVPPIARFA